jgi:DNA-binding NarL/FixJ family response regulator
MPPRRVLVVEDHEPFRRAICTLLAQRADLEIVGEAANGPDAVRLAEGLQPELVTLDIGLPGLAGLETTTRLAAVAPHARILLVTNEWASAVVEEAFRRGAHGYVYKLRVARDLLRAIEVVADGGRFNGGLERIARGGALTSHRHDLLFYSNEAAFVRGTARFVARALQEESAVLVLVEDQYRDGLRRRLELDGVDVDRAAQDGRYVQLCSGQLLSKIMVDGQPDAERFSAVVGDPVVRAAEGGAGRARRVVVCGECSPLVWAQGHVEAALRLEHLWDLLAKSQQVDLQCAYPLTVRQEEVRTVRRLCATHTTVEIS